ncbi:hypothetical protein Nit79A3_0308 [Nitrosomonas sp. Is79A3]|uniref:hypothetical protein n=1 Tax=Nitrosomonas sp. (strain Is79A3) TaxID=261292 RepID=UPI000215D27D
MSNISFGSWSYSVTPSANTVNLSVSNIQNNSYFDSTGTIKLELWLTTSPWNDYAANIGYEIAVDQLTGPTNGTLGPNQFFSNINNTVSYLNHPPAGAYYVTLAVTEYTGNNLSSDNGYVLDAKSTDYNNIFQAYSDNSISIVPVNPFESKDDSVFNWAENRLPSYFSEHQPSHNISGYYARMYSDGFAVGEKDGNIYVAFSDGPIELVGSVDSYYSVASAAGF